MATPCYTLQKYENREWLHPATPCYTLLHPSKIYKKYKKYRKIIKIYSKIIDIIY